MYYSDWKNLHNATYPLSFFWCRRPTTIKTSKSPFPISEKSIWANIWHFSWQFTTHLPRSRLTLNSLPTTSGMWWPKPYGSPPTTSPSKRSRPDTPHFTKTRRSEERAMWHPNTRKCNKTQILLHISQVLQKQKKVMHMKRHANHVMFLGSMHHREWEWNCRTRS